ncbi:MAG: IMPACT family protein [Syntrophothermus sp.]
MISEDTFITIARETQGSYREKGSKFIAFAFPVTSEDEIKDRLALLRKEYFDARHHCYAWCLGHDKSQYRINDDGEPSGSAGRPIFGQIQSLNLTNILVVVIRYFGGVKLGIPGLINAYRTATREALDVNTLVTKTVDDQLQVIFEYLRMNEVMRILKDPQVKILSQEFDNQCNIGFSVRRSVSPRIISGLEKIEGISVVHLSKNVGS